jgi:dTDP-4-amino-4,6-dideoxygalactose transaminase
LGAYSFHETKNVTSGGEGGLLLINDDRFIQRAEIIREKGTNRSQFFRGMVDKYSWVDIGSSYLPSELQAAYLWGQLLDAERITLDRMHTWETYFQDLKPLCIQGLFELPRIPDGCVHNAHMFYIKTRDLTERTDLIDYLVKAGVHAVFHYVPLHSATAGRRLGRFVGHDRHTTSESERLVRLPIWYGMSGEQRQQVVESVKAFYKSR